jgi:hypothetical protein
MQGQLCEARVNQAHAYARFADTNLDLALHAQQGAANATKGIDGVCRGSAALALTELFTAMRGKPIGSIPKILPVSALNSLVSLQVQEAERSIARADAATGAAQSTINWHYERTAPAGKSPTCDPNEDAPRDRHDSGARQGRD